LALFEASQYSQCLRIPFEAPDFVHFFLERVFTRMTKWGVPQIVGERNKLD